MVTPDFEDWLLKQEVRPENTTTLEDYLDYLERELGIHGGSLDVAREIYEQKYLRLADLGIRPIERRTTIAGEEYKELRFAIKGIRGLFGRLNTYRIAADRAIELGDYESAQKFLEMAAYLEQYPERRLVRWRAEEH